MDIIEILEIIISFSLGVMTLYFTAYTKAKGTNKALKEDISKLEDEKQKIIAKYRAETEELKKQHSLDIEKRKFQYEDKRTQFTKYFSMIDQFQNKSRVLITERFSNIMSEFISSSITGNEETKKKTMYKFTNDIQSMLNEMYEEQVKISHETNSIRLIASPEIDVLLTEFETALINSNNSATEMVRFMTTPQFMADQTLLAPYQQASEESGTLVSEYRVKLKDRMKHELNEI
ncbi:hypothetical protein [Sulfurovum sp.]|uniref:hypothetical protein n=1 Tax=Sulfurovum sp. TaxID=1969726 RepID=UPI0035636AB6